MTHDASLPPSNNNGASAPSAKRARMGNPITVRAELEAEPQFETIHLQVPACLGRLVQGWDRNTG